MKKLLGSVALLALVTVAVPAAHAQNAVAPVAPAPGAPAVTDPGHPRVNEVDQRLENQQNRVDTGVNKGQIGAKQEMRDDKTDAHVSQELSKDEAKNNGHVTKAEQRKMNRQLNHNSNRIHAQRVRGERKAKAAGTTTAQ